MSYVARRNKLFARKEYSVVSGRVWRSPGKSSLSRRKLFRGQRYIAQTGAASRTDPRKTAIGDREGSRSASLWPRAYLLPFGKLECGAGDHSKLAEADGPLLACPPECRTRHCQAKRPEVRCVTVTFRRLYHSPH